MVLVRQCPDVLPTVIETFARRIRDNSADMLEPPADLSRIYVTAAVTRDAWRSLEWSSKVVEMQLPGSLAIDSAPVAQRPRQPV
jgi:hypothetical protein